MEILFSDSQLLIVNKPAGLPVLPDGWQPGAPYLLRELSAEFGRLWVVHRLDKITSGVMVLARSAEAHRALNEQFERHAAHKIYHALVCGAPGWEAHTARHKLRINVGHSHRTVVDHAKGKPAETAFRLLQRGKSLSLLEARPATGRTHQIRVHLYALGFPILGDSLYSAPPTAFIARPALHAFSLTLADPLSGAELTFSAPYPADFSLALQRLNDELLAQN